MEDDGSRCHLHWGRHSAAVAFPGAGPGREGPACVELLLSRQHREPGT